MQGMTKTEFKDFIIRQLGYPLVKVELHESQLDDIIRSTKSVYTKWASGNVTSEDYVILQLEADKSEYELPQSVTTVLDVKDFSSGIGKTDELFTLGSYLNSIGILEAIQGSTFSLMGYHASLDYMKTLEKYSTEKFFWKHNRFKNVVTLKPTPDSTDDLSYILVHCYILSDYSVESDGEEYIEGIYEDDWFQRYCIAGAKEILGRVRGKFGQGFQSIGNQGISLDGDTLLSEAKEEKEKLLEELRDHEDYEGFYPLMG